MRRHAGWSWGGLVVVAPLRVYREVVESSRRLEEERRRMRGIEAVGGDRSREVDHTYRSWVQRSATTADPWSEEPKG